MCLIRSTVKTDELPEEWTGWKAFRADEQGRLFPLFAPLHGNYQECQPGQWCVAKEVKEAGIGYRLGWHVYKDRVAADESRHWFTFSRSWSHTVRRVRLRRLTATGLEQAWSGPAEAAVGCEIFVEPEGEDNV